MTVERREHAPRAWVVVGGAALAGLLAAFFSAPVAWIFWVGLGTALGRGDPTWNDGEGPWLVALGMVLVGAWVLVLTVGVRVIARRAAATPRWAAIALWLAPSLLVHVTLAPGLLGVG